MRQKDLGDRRGGRGREGKGRRAREEGDRAGDREIGEIERKGVKGGREGGE